MKNKTTQFRVLIGATGLLLASSAWGFDMGNMMNPSRWMGGNSDRYDDDYYYDGPGYGYPGGPPGYGYGGPGYGYGGPGYGGPGYGYGGAPGYGYGGMPGYGAPASGNAQEEILRLKERLRHLEGTGPR